MLMVTSVLPDSRSLVIFLVVVSMVVGFMSPDFYRVVKHGRSADEDKAAS
jgi:hypothetical protein